MRRVTRWQRLGTHIRDARARVGMLTQQQLADRAGIGKRTVSDLERGARDTYSPDTLAAVETALGWAPGAIQEILAGRTPQTEDDALAALLAAWPLLSERDRRAVVAIVRILADR